jgi:hypothetical protein
MFHFFYPVAQVLVAALFSHFVSSSLTLSSSPAAVPMASPTELAGDEINEETIHLGDDDLIPSQFVADSFSQVPSAAPAPRNLHGVASRGLEVACEIHHRCCASD